MLIISIALASATRDAIRALGKGAIAIKRICDSLPHDARPVAAIIRVDFTQANCKICNPDSLACIPATILCPCIQPPLHPPVRVVAMSFFARLVGKKQTDGDNPNANKDKQTQQQQTQKQQGEEAEKNGTAQSNVAPRAIGGLPRINVSAG